MGFTCRTSTRAGSVWYFPATAIVNHKTRQDATGPYKRKGKIRLPKTVHYIMDVVGEAIGEGKREMIQSVSTNMRIISNEKDSHIRMIRIQGRGVVQGEVLEPRYAYIYL